MINLDRNAYGPCGHHAVNIGPEGCSICLRHVRGEPFPYMPAPAGRFQNLGGSAMEEVKVSKPLNREEMRGMISKYIAGSEEAIEGAKVLRERILRGQQVLAMPDLTESERTSAETRMVQLRESLRAAEWQTMLALGLAMGHGVAAILSETAQQDHWDPPAGSLCRIYLPGICDVTVALENYGEEG